MQQRPQIDYPCPWSYVVVGAAGEAELLVHIERALGGADYERAPSRHSSGGRYTSIEVTLTVRDEEHRLGIFRALRNHPLVRVVL